MNGESEYLFRKAAARPASLNFRLEATDIHLWSVTLDNFSFHNHEFVRILSFDELVEAQKIASEEARKHFIACRGLLRHILSCYVDAQPKEIPVEFGDEQESRVLAGPGRTIRFDLSCSAGGALYAIAADRRLGVSLAALGPVSEETIVSESSRFELMPSERQEILALPEEARPVAYFRIVTRKEALARALGAGLAMSAAASREGATVSVQRAPPLAESGRWVVGGWTVEDVAVLDGYASAVAARHEDWRLRAIFVKPD